MVTIIIILTCKQPSYFSNSFFLNFLVDHLFALDANFDASALVYRVTLRSLAIRSDVIAIVS